MSQITIRSREKPTVRKTSKLGAAVNWIRSVPWWWWVFWAAMFVINGIELGWSWAWFHLAILIGSYYLGGKMYDWTHPE